MSGLPVAWPVSNFAQRLPTTLNNMQQQTQHVPSNHMGVVCWPTMSRLHGAQYNSHMICMRFISRNDFMGHKLFAVTKSFPKIHLEIKWNTTFWVVPAENFWEQRNIWKGNPILPEGIFQTEIRVPVFQSTLWYQFQASAVVFLVQMVNAIPGLTLPVKNFAT